MSYNYKWTNAFLPGGPNAEALGVDLIVAAGKGDKDVVEMLINAGVNVEAKDGNDTTALILAADRGHTDVVRMLIDKGANVEAKAGNGDSALKFAAKGGHIDIVRMLLEAIKKAKETAEVSDTLILAAKAKASRRRLKLRVAKKLSLRLRELAEVRAAAQAAGEAAAKVRQVRAAAKASRAAHAAAQAAQSALKELEDTYEEQVRSDIISALNTVGGIRNLRLGGPKNLNNILRKLLEEREELLEATQAAAQSAQAASEDAALAVSEALKAIQVQKDKEARARAAALSRTERSQAAAERAREKVKQKELSEVLAATAWAANAAAAAAARSVKNTKSSIEKYYWTRRADAAVTEFRKINKEAGGKRKNKNATYRMLKNAGFEVDSGTDSFGHSVWTRTKTNVRDGRERFQKISVASTPTQWGYEYTKIQGKIEDAIRDLYLDTPEGNIITGNPSSRWDKDTEPGQGAL